jgi:hypothetical protein
MEVPNKLFYNNRIKDGHYQEQSFFIHPSKPLLFIDLKGFGQKREPSYFNEDEGKFALNLIQELTEPYGRFGDYPYPKEWFNIMTPYWG